MRDDDERLVWAYPAGPRRDEIVDLLGQARAAGVTPSGRTRINLVRHGLRARLGRPASRAVVVAAVLVSLVTAVLGAFAAEAVAWPATPAVPDLRAVAPAVFPGQAAQEYRDGYMIVPAAGRREYFTGTDDEDRYGSQSLWLSLPPATDTSAWSAGARDRLEAGGWRYRGGGAESFWLTRNGYAIELGLEESDASVTVVRTMPWWMVAAVVLAGLAGAAGGWLLTGWVSRRTERRSGLLRSGVTTLTSTVLVLMIPHALFGLHLEISNIFLLALPTAPPWVALFKLYGWYMFSTSVVLTAMIIALAATRRPAEDERVTVAS